jgi:hypothetical protein
VDNFVEGFLVACLNPSAKTIFYFPPIFCAHLKINIKQGVASLYRCCREIWAAKPRGVEGCGLFANVKRHFCPKTRGVYVAMVIKRPSFLVLLAGERERKFFVWRAWSD